MKTIRSALLIFVWLTVLTGVVYPLAVTLVAQVVFPHQANGSVIQRNGKAVGSELIGQSFDNPRYFWSRPSAIAQPYDAASSSGSNLGPTNEDLIKAVNSRVEAIRQAHPDQTGLVPVDLVTASASGLDPHISPASAEYQINRVANARGVDPARVRELVNQCTSGRTLGLFGEPRVHVLSLNLALDNERTTP